VNKATSEAIWDWNVITGEVYYGEGFFKLFGYQTLNLPQNFNIWESRIHPEDFERISHSISTMILSKETNWTEEYRYLKHDKTYANVIDKGFILRDHEGHALRMIGSMQDVTIQKKEEEHLKLLESVITNAHDSVLITEAVNDHPIIFANKAFTTMTGYEFEEVKGKNPRFLQGPNSDKIALKKLKDAMSNWEACEITIKNYRKNGEEFWINFSISPVKNQKGEYTHWISIERDVSDIIKANTEIENQKKFTEDILNNIPTDIAVFDVNHNYLFVNPHGIKNPEIRKWIINKNDFDYTKMRNVDDTLARQRWQLFEDAVESKKKVAWIDEHKNKEGEDIYVLRNFYPYFENEKLKFIIGYGIDITERKVIEIKLNEAIESIKKSNNELEQFAYVASHDLQEPLRMVTSFLSQLEKKYGEQLDEKAKEYIFYAVDGAKRMRQIILDLLEYSRVGKNEGQINEIDINNVIEEIKVLHSKQIEELNAIITYEKMPVVMGNKTPVRQIFLNLISNALKYIRKGIAPEISINCIDHIESWEFIIKDNGIGIEPEFYEKIFIIFQRLHNKDEFSGTGIGLAITKKIIDNMGGRIWVSANDDYGSTFHFTIPKNKK
jgi:PAS domain S-box-containing protein